MTALPSSLFADAAFFRALRSVVAPQLRTWPYANVWLVGCGTGEQAFAIAIALREEGLFGRIRLHATEVEDAPLSRAREATYPASTLAVAHQRYVDGGGRASLVDYLIEKDEVVTVCEDVRQQIVFAQHSPDIGGSFAEQQLIVCRGALGRFALPQRRRAWSLLHDSLCRFGLLAVDRAESLSDHPQRGSYEAVDALHGVYRRGDA